MRYSVLTKQSSGAVILRCPVVSCGHEWKYKGESKFYASCPFCRTNVSVVRDRIQVEKENNPGPESPSQTRITSNRVGVETPRYGATNF